MDSIKVTGGAELNGIIPISGAKNAALPLMIASLLTDETLTLSNVPRLRDVAQLMQILSNHGVDYSVNGKRTGQDDLAGQTLNLTAREIVDTTAPYELVSKMRASFWVVGPLVARMHEARVSLPGGCAIGTRPVDFFIQGLEALGADIEIEGGYVVVKAPGGLTGGRVEFPRVSVGATHTIMMAATLAKGETEIVNAAREPEVVDLGPLPEGHGRPDRRRGHVNHPHSRRAASSWRAPCRRSGPDRDRHLCHGGCHDGRRCVFARRAHRASGKCALDTLRQTGAEITATDEGLRVYRNGNGIQPADVTTEPFPGFPTDLQAQFMALMTKAGGKSRITETIFENRFMHVQELARLGAQIAIDGRTATVEGVSTLRGAPVMATDLRASVSLVIAGLAAEGETTVSRVYHLDRGFERLEDKLTRCGAQIQRISGLTRFTTTQPPCG
jgi:UDP-N-acetylglucosamine 1-carboxyvinyltransferase